MKACVDMILKAAYSFIRHTQKPLSYSFYLVQITSVAVFAEV